MRNILVVDDEDKIRNIYIKLLEDEGYVVFESSNVSVAYEIATSNTIDLIILDIKMPENGGNILYEVLQFLQVKSKILVASVYPLEIQKMMVPDAADYYDKSHNLDILLEKITTILTDN
ncbi:MAG: response regulator [Spirochaetota bacterium]|nr:MAG: response regulator [Spirochaetota bacterium]